jgi:hypothetical protein
MALVSALFTGSAIAAVRTERSFGPFPRGKRKSRGHGDHHARRSENLPPIMPVADRSADRNVIVAARPVPHSTFGGDDPAEDWFSGVAASGEKVMIVSPSPFPFPLPVRERAAEGGRGERSTSTARHRSQCPGRNVTTVYHGYRLRV